MSNSAVHMIVHGTVQGVGFRFFVREQAARHGLKGWVRNVPDGTVEIVAEGEKTVLDEFIGKVKRGPMFGYVSEVTEEWIEATNSFAGFTITF